MNRIRTLALAITAATLVATPLAAQSTASASLSVTAKIANPISLAVTAPLDFGTMFAGTARTITPDAANGGRFTVTGEAGAAIAITLQMPSAVTAAGGASIPLSAWTYAMGPSASLTGVTPVSFNGSAGTPISAALPGSAGTVSRVYVSIGATASPGASAVTGTYSATGQITAAYVGM